MQKFGILNIFIVIIFGLTLSALSFFCVVNKNFKDIPSVINFFNNANVYPNLTEITKITLRNYYSPMLQENVLQLALADKLADTLITPTVIKSVVDPGLKLSVAFSNQPTSIIENKVVVDTTKYKQQILQDINNYDLPKLVNSGISYFLTKVPQYVTLIDNQKHPNNLLATIIKARTFLQYNHMGLQISWVVLGLTILVLLINNILNLKRLVLTLGISLAVSGVVTLFVFVLIPWVISSSVPVTADAYVMAQNKLIYDGASYLIKQIGYLAYIYVGIALIFGVIWKFVKLDSLQAKINKLLHKLKIPVLSVKVERL